MVMAIAADDKAIADLKTTLSQREYDFLNGLRIAGLCTVSASEAAMAAQLLERRLVKCVLIIARERGLPAFSMREFPAFELTNLGVWELEQREKVL
jgi:hypothetical protein